MKIVAGDSVTIIYPFVAEDEEPAEATVQIMVFHAGGIKLWTALPLMGAGAVRILAEALLRAVEMVERGRE